MIHLKAVADCTWNEALQAWNEGFQGYFVDVQMNSMQFTKRLAMLELSPDRSVVAFEDTKPVGILLTGIRMIWGRKIAWNGGTAVAKCSQGKGIGRMMMEYILDCYRAEDVDVATLEAIGENEKAIALYEKKGYKVSDYLFYMEQTGIIPNTIVSHAEYPLYSAPASRLEALPFYRATVPWQCHASHIQDALAYIASDSMGNEIGYLLYKYSYKESGELDGIALYQCVVDSHEHEAHIIETMLHAILHPEQEIKRTAVHIQASNNEVISMLNRIGFETKVKQVQMIVRLKE